MNWRASSAGLVTGGSLAAHALMIHLVMQDFPMLIAISELVFCTLIFRGPIALSGTESMIVALPTRSEMFAFGLKIQKISSSTAGVLHSCLRAGDALGSRAEGLCSIVGERTV